MKNNLLRRFWVSVSTTFVLLFLSLYFKMTEHYLLSVVEFFLVTITILCGLPFLKKGWISIHVFTPIAFSVTVIYLFNIIQLLFPNFFSSFFYVYTQKINFETAAVITTLILMEQVLELKIGQKIGKLSEDLKSQASILVRVNLSINYFIAAMFLLALLTFFIWIFLGSRQLTMDGLFSSLNVLIVTCPFALSLAVSLPMQAGITQGVKSGIVFKNTKSLEQFEKVDIIIFNKAEIKLLSSLAIKKLHEAEIRIVLVTDDADLEKDSAELFRIDAVESANGPEQSDAIIKRLQEQGFVVAVVGFDQAAIADFNISKNQKATNANLILLHDDLFDVVRASILSKIVMNNIRQNLFFILIYSAICIPIAVGIFYPYLIFNLLLSVLLMSFSWGLVMINAWRLRHISM